MHWDTLASPRNLKRAFLVTEAKITVTGIQKLEAVYITFHIRFTACSQHPLFILCTLFHFPFPLHHIPAKPRSFRLEACHPIAMAEEQAESSFKLYHYDPSVAAAVVFVILFLATSIYHVWQMVRARTWFFTAFIIGGICEQNTASTSRRSLTIPQSSSSDMLDVLCQPVKHPTSR